MELISCVWAALLTPNVRSKVNHNISLAHQKTGDARARWPELELELELGPALNGGAHSLDEVP